MTVIEDIVDDSEYLTILFNDIDNLDELEESFEVLPNIPEKKNIMKLYKNKYNFSTNALLRLMKDLKFLGSKRIFEILILLK